MAKTEVDRRGALVNPVHPCIKAEGLCRIRWTDSPDFQCVFNGRGCRYLVKKEEPAGEQ